MLAKKKHEVDMLNGPILPRALEFALPLMLSSLLQLLYNAADIVVVGRFAGPQALAAAMPILNVPSGWGLHQPSTSLSCPQP